jgi:thioredoxin 1
MTVVTTCALHWILGLIRVFVTWRGFPHLTINTENCWYSGGIVNEPIHVTDAAFEKAVLQSPVPVLVDFWAPWCMPCRMVAPSLEKLAKEYEGRLVVAKVNTDESPEWAIKYGVQGIPTMLIIKDGQVSQQQVGALPYPYLKQMVEQALGKPQVKEQA